MNQKKTDKYWKLHKFAMEVLKAVAVQTHTNWEIFLEPVIKENIKNF